MGRVLCHSNGIALLLGLILTLGGASILEAQGPPQLLKGPPTPLGGTYDFAARVTCAVGADGTDGFDDTDNLFDRDGDGFSATFTVQGRVTYAGDSPGSFTGQVLQVNPAANADGATPIAQATVNCTVANTLNVDGTFTETRTCTGDPTAGVNADPSDDRTVSFTVNFEGAVGPRRGIIHYHDTKLIVETFTLTDNDTNSVIATRKRICTRFGIAINPVVE